MLSKLNKFDQLYAKVTLPNGYHVTLSKETKSKQTARKLQSSVWV